MKTPADAHKLAHPSTAFSLADPSTAVSPAGTNFSAAGSGRLTRHDDIDGDIDGRPLPQQFAPPMRRYETMSLDPQGRLQTSTHIAPALPLFESAVSAFARGTLITTQSGQVAIEDLVPGDWITTVDGDPAPIQWIGSTTFRPEPLARQSNITHMTRVIADAFGLARPMSYITAGPAARILHTPDHLRASAGGAKMLTHVRSFVDGVNVIEITPPAPVQLFHLCLKRHSVICAGGLEVETYHPGAAATHSVSYNLRNIYLSMFDHISHISDFGRMVYPHAPDEVFDDMSVA